MSNEVIKKEINETAQAVEDTEANKAEPVTDSTTEQKQEKQTDNGMFGIKFFKSCSTSLKRFSILIFIVNVFLAVGITGVVTVLLTVNVGVDMLSLLALPLVTLFVILVVVARCISAFVYGFAIIVENNEKK